MSTARLKDVMYVQTTTYGTEMMIAFILSQLEELNSSEKDIELSWTVKDENIYITKGIADTYPCVVAHTDTVHDIVKDFEVFERRDIMFSMDYNTCTQVGIGGDDKVGIYVALEALRKHENIKVAFFRDEEHGCLGSRVADMGFFKNVEFVLQCDRQGFKDFVSRIMGKTLFDKPFSEAIAPLLKEHGKEETTDGGMTDVYQLVENGLKVCVANLSCGYYSPHSDEEVIVVSQVMSTLDLVNDIIENLSGEIWLNSEFGKSPYISRYGSYYGGRYGSYYGDYDDFYDDPRDRPVLDTKKNESEGERPPKDRLSYTENDFTDLETRCSWCDDMEIMYDVCEDADWCFQCTEYTNRYNHFGDNFLDDDYDELTDEDYLNAFEGYDPDEEEFDSDGVPYKLLQQESYHGSKNFQEYIDTHGEGYVEQEESMIPKKTKK